jgi:DNA-binding response OmpR family regulator
MDKVKILVVDDEEATLKFVKNCIDRAIDCEVYEAENGDQAIAQMKANDFDLVVLDIKMSGMNGLDVMREVKKVKVLPDVLVVTGYDSVQLSHEVIDAGAVDYMPKPVFAENLMLKIKGILEKKGKYIEKQY